MPTDIFIKLGDIKGESLDSKHKESIEVLSFSWGVTSTAGAASTGSGGASGKSTFQDLAFTHAIDRASPELLRVCATGEHLKEATITHRKAGKAQPEFLIVKMNDVVITSVAHGGTPEGSTESVTLAFAKVALEYKRQRPDGTADSSVFFKYDLINRKTI